MSTNPIVTHYWDHHKVIKAIEKCSLQAIFGPNITSTTDLVPQTIQVPSGVTFKANNESKNASVGERARSNRIPLLFAKSRDGLLPIDPLEEDGNIAPDLIAKKNGKKNSKHVTQTNRRGNIPSEMFTSGSSMPAVSTFENSTTPVVQSDLLRQVPLETWDQKVEELRVWTRTQRISRDIHDFSYSNHKHPNHDRLWDSRNLFCIGCTKDTMKNCGACGRYCCLWSICRNMADAQAGTLPQERVLASQWLKKIASLMSYGIDEPTFMACYRCTRVLCPKCTSICEICDALSCPDCCSRCPICQVPKCFRCKPNRKEVCSYHKGPPVV